MGKAVFLLLAALASSGANAEIWKCQSSQGMVYTNRPCEGTGTKLDFNLTVTERYKSNYLNKMSERRPERYQDESQVSQIDQAQQAAPAPAEEPAQPNIRVKKDSQWAFNNQPGQSSNNGLPPPPPPAFK